MTMEDAIEHDDKKTAANNTKDVMPFFIKLFFIKRSSNRKPRWKLTFPNHS